MLIALLWVSNSTSAAASDPELSADKISTVLYTIEADIEGKRFLLQNLDSYLEQLPTFTAWAKQCITDYSTHLADAEEHLKVLGEAVDDEPTDVSLTRQNLITEKDEVEDSLASCKVILIRSDTSIKKISTFRKENLKRQSFDRGRNIATVFKETVTESHQWMFALVGVLASKEGIHALTGSELLMLISICIITLTIGLMIRKTLQHWDGKTLARWQRTNLDEDDTGMRVVAALAMTTRRYIVPVLLSISIGVFMYIETSHRVPTPLITIIMDRLTLLILALAVTYFVFKALIELGLRDDIDPAIARSLRKRINILALIWFIGYLLFQTILTNSLSEAVFFLARALLGVILVLNVVWIVWLTKNIKGHALNTSVRITTSLILFSAVIAELTGYRNLSSFILQGIVGTLVAYGLFQITSHLVSTLLHELDVGKTSWQQRLRQNIGVSGGESIPGFVWMKLTASISIWLIFIISLLAVWNVPESDVKALGIYITQGFTIGSIEIVPFRIFEAIIVLIMLLAINGWLQQQLENKWLTIAKIEHGARESITTIGNYIGIALATIVALAVAGMDFSKLAIIAGALSVGIGFGLQNIVNNFVSGLILLFERPIKTGDWIATRGVEGYVRKINIRSTQIESFDHSDIIVPNSELTSGNLINWMHKDRKGRIRIPIGVAYGSNTEQVRDLLTDIANDHPAVITHHPTMHNPKVMFLSFGDSSLDLELRFFVHDIKQRVDILSDMNFAIDKVFRENGIEIPFPQRDVHIRDAITKVSDIDKDADNTDT